MLIEKYIGNKKNSVLLGKWILETDSYAWILPNHTLNYKIGKRERIKCMSSVLAKKIGDRLTLTKVKHFDYLLWY